MRISSPYSRGMATLVLWVFLHTHCNLGTPQEVHLTTWLGVGNKEATAPEDGRLESRPKDSCRFGAEISGLTLELGLYQESGGVRQASDHPG